jgi:hypothetical protein
MAANTDAAESMAEQEARGRVPSATSKTDLHQDLGALEKFDASALRAEWRRLYRSQPPRLSRDLLVRGIAYRLQELGTGGMGKATRRKLAAFARELEASGSLAVPTSPQLRPGARLVREWRGRTHAVAVLEDGFAYGGKTYPSLTKIAQAITGAHWSGPRFFGLTDRRDSAEQSDDGAGGSRTPRADSPAEGLAGGAHV